MRRIHLFELEDQYWFPKQIRDTGTDWIRFIVSLTNPYRPIIPRLKEAIRATGSQQVLDLCSGAGGPIPGLHRQLAEAGLNTSITLTDRFPNIAALRHVRDVSDGAIDFVEEPVDATVVPAHLSGFRTFFASFHHFRPETARRILQDAVDKRCPIGVFEFSERSFLPVVLTLLFPILLLLATPFIRPFRWSRLFWTYLVPIAPLYVLWDASVSNLRTYSPRELEDLVREIDAPDFVWEIGREPSKAGAVTYLIGYARGR